MKKTTISIIAAGVIAINSNATDFKDLGTITITSATKSNQSIKEVTSNVEVITGAELEEKHITTVAEALNLVSGINFTRSGGLGSSTSIMLRGMDTKMVLVLIDGINFKNPASTSGASFEHLMIGDIERIEIIKGAQSSIWGNDAAAGVINIITKDVKAGIHSTINLEKGSFDTKKLLAIISGKNKTFDMKFTLNKITSDGFTSGVPKGDNIDKYEDDNYKNTTISVAGNYNLSDKDRVGFDYTLIDAVSNYDGWNDPNAIRRSDTKDNLFSVHYDTSLNKHNIKLKYSNSNFKKDELDEVIATYVKLFNGKLQNYELSDNFDINNKNNLLIGTSYEVYDVTYTRVDTLTQSKKVDIKSIFANNTNKNDTYIFTQSLRMDDFSTSGEKITGKVGFKYLVNKDVNININYGTAYNAPNILELLNPWGAVAGEVVIPEKTNSFDVGFNYKNLNFSYFDTKVKDMISWYDPNPNNDWSIQDGTFVNRPGTSTLKGYEIAYKQDIFDDLLASVSYTKLDAKNSKDEFLARRPKETLKFGLDYYGIEKVNIGVNGEYIGKRYDQDGNKGSQTGKYTILNTVIGYEYKRDLSFFARIENLTDKYYQISDGYATSPRSFYAGIKASF